MLRLKFTKLGRLQYISHTELMRTMEKGARRANLPLLHTKGFRPRVKVSFSPPLPIGIESRSEFVDFFLEEYVSPRQAELDLGEALPQGLDVLEAKILGEGAKPVGRIIDTAEYAIGLRGIPDRGLLGRVVERFLGEASLPYERVQYKGSRMVDLREGTYALELLEENGEIGKSDTTSLSLVCKDGIQGTVKPMEVIEVLLAWVNVPSPSRDMVTVVRTGLFAYRAGRMISPMDMGRNRPLI